LLGLHRSFGVEMHDRALDALLAAPVPRESLFVGKALANLVFVLGVQVIAIPAVFVLYKVPLGIEILYVIGLAVLAAIGFVAVGTLFSSMASNTRLAELLLPLLTLPFFIPVVVAAASSSQRVIAGRPLAESMAWLQLLVAFDIVFVYACTFAFPYTLEE
jgi:heme exporter protein B